jgi:tRNA pseudouridine38-40 synthase
VLLHIEGSHFIWKMVRRIVGVLVAAGRGDLDAADVAAMLHGEGGSAAPLTAPASGLFLERVYYTGERRDTPLRPAAVVMAR